MDKQNTKTIIFDLGGVIIDLDVGATVKAFAQIMQKPVADVWGLMETRQFLVDYEKGLISSAQFRDEIRDLAQMQLADSEVDAAWNAMLGNIPMPRLGVMLHLRATHQVMVLSNTNDIHEKAFHQILASVSGKDHLRHFADKVYFSHEMKMRKPDTEIYQQVLIENNLVPAETLFLDDKLENLTGAEQCGIRTMHITHSDLLLTLGK